MATRRKLEVPVKKKNSEIMAVTTKGGNNYHRMQVHIDGVKVFDRSTFKLKEYRALKKVFDDLIKEHTKRHTKVRKYVEKW